MLRSNSTKAKQNIIAYIKKYALDALAEYDITPANDVEMLAAVWMICKSEKSYYFDPAGPYKGIAHYKIFKDWAQGLAMNDLFCYYYNRSARDDLAAILEETEAEAAQYTETEAKETLTKLIYREVRNGYAKTAF